MSEKTDEIALKLLELLTGLTKEEVAETLEKLDSHLRWIGAK